MNYGLWIHGDLDRARLAEGLADMLSVPVQSVDVGYDGEDDRNWEAPVSCTVTPVAGDLQWHLDIYVARAVPSPATEPMAAAWLAGRLKVVVAYEAAPVPPSAFWLVGPDGRRTRARIYEDDAEDDVTVYRIDAVEHPLDAMPGLRVAALPEVIRSYRMPTPLADRIRAGLVGNETPAAQDAVNRLGAWESMVARLIEGWPPDGWYPAEYYREDLEIRDALAALTSSLPNDVRTGVDQALVEIDRRFSDATQESDGLHRPHVDNWWWSRVPQPPPWRDIPGRSEG